MTRPGEPFFRRGAKAYNAGDNVAAQREFTAGLLHDPTSAPGYLFRGLTRLRLNLLDDALADFTSALDRDPACADAAWARGRLLSERGQWADAARDFGRVIAAKPDDERAWSARGEAFHHLGDWPRCVACYRRAVELAPTDARNLNRFAWVLATCVADGCRNGQEALDLARRANQLSAGADPFILDTLAAALAASGDFTAALVEIVRLESIAPPELAKLLPARRAAYAAGQPWRER